MSDRPPVLRADGVSQAYGGRVALSGIDLEVRAGEMFGLLGPNGAGKTTLLSILSGLTGPESGRVELFGEPLTASAREARRRVGLVPQELAVYPDLSARENLRFFGKLYGLGGPELDRRAGDLLAAVGLLDRAGDRAGTFSGGMQRRLNLAAALVHSPDILYLDEPTTGVDPQSRNRIFEFVKEQSRGGLTVVYTSHYMEEVETLCPRLAIIDHGRLLACGTLASLLSLLPSVVTARLPGDMPNGLLASLSARDGWEVTAEGKVIELACADAGAAAFELAGELHRAGVGGAAIETRRPSLESVFLHLTGRALRD